MQESTASLNQRERVFFIGLRKSALKKKATHAFMREDDPREFSPFPEKTHSLDNAWPNKLATFVATQKVLEDLDEPDEARDLDQKTYSKAKWYGGHCQGNKEIDLKKLSPTIRSEHHGNIEFRRLAESHGGRNKKELKEGKIERRLTIRECCRIQTLPDSYHFLSDIKGEGVSASEAYKLIGNAVPPLLAYHFAKRLESIWGKLF